MKYIGANIVGLVVWACSWIGSLIQLVPRAIGRIIKEVWSKSKSFISNIRRWISRSSFSMDTSDICPICWETFGETVEGKETNIRLVEGKKVKFFELKNHGDGDELVIKTKCGHVFHMKCLRHWLYTRRTMGVSEEEWTNSLAALFKNYGEFRREERKRRLTELASVNSWSCPICKSLVLPTECKHMWYTITDPIPENSQKHESTLGKIQALVENHETLLMKFGSTMKQVRHYADLADDAMDDIRRNNDSIKKTIDLLHKTSSATKTDSENQSYQIPSFFLEKLKTSLQKEEECENEFEALVEKVMGDGIKNKLWENNDILRRTISHLLKPRSAGSPSMSEENRSEDSWDTTSTEDSGINNSVSSHGANAASYDEEYPPVSVRVRNFEQRARMDGGTEYFFQSLPYDTLPPPDPNIQVTSINDGTAPTEAAAEDRGSYYPANAEDVFNRNAEQIRGLHGQEERESDRGYSRWIADHDQATDPANLRANAESFDVGFQAHYVNGVHPDPPEAGPNTGEAVAQSPLAGRESTSSNFSDLPGIANQDRRSSASSSIDVEDLAWGGSGSEYSELETLETENAIISELKKLSLPDDSLTLSPNNPDTCHGNFHTCQGLEYEVLVGSRIVFRKNSDNLFGRVVKNVTVNDVLWVGIRFDKHTDGSNFRDSCANALAVKSCMMIPVCRLRVDSRFSIFDPSAIYPPGVVQAGFILGTVKLGERVIWYDVQNEAFTGTVKWIGFINESLDLMAGVDFDEEVEDPYPELTSRLFPFEGKHGGLIPVKEMVKLSDFIKDN